MLNRKFSEISIDLISINPEQPRKNFSADEISELANSIENYGVLQPVIVSKCENGTFLLVAGERRFRACKEVGLKRIPAIIKEFNEKECAMISLIENVQRENLNFFEEAYAYKKIIEEYGFTQVELSDKIGKKQSTISNKLRLIALSPEIRKVILNSGLTERHARAILRISPEEKQLYILNRIVSGNLNVKQSEKMIDDFINGEELKRRKAKSTNYISYKIYLNTIRNAFSQIKEVEEGAIIKEVDSGDYMEVNILIPKNKRCFT